MKRFPAFLNRLQLPGVKKNQVALHLTTPEVFLWVNDRLHTRQSHIGYDTLTDRFFLASPTALNRQLGPAHLKTISFIEEGKITDVAAARSFVSLWLQQLTDGDTTWFQLLSGTYVIPSDISEAQLQIYTQVFQEIPGSWSAVRTSSLLPTVLTKENISPSCGTILHVTNEYLEISILSENEVTRTRTHFFGIRDLKAAIDQVLREQYQIVTDTATHAHIYQELATSKLALMEKRVSIRGKDLTTSLPKNIVIELSSFSEGMQWWMSEIVNELQVMYSQLSTAELSLLGQDIALLGAGAHLHLLQLFLTETLKVSVSISVQPEKSVIKALSHVTTNG